MLNSSGSDFINQKGMIENLNSGLTNENAGARLRFHSSFLLLRLWSPPLVPLDPIPELFVSRCWPSGHIRYTRQGTRTTSTLGQATQLNLLVEAFSGPWR